MIRKGWGKFDKIMRWLHLYLALFLAPWLLLYATSAFFLNHNDSFRDLFKVIPPGWAIIEEQDLKLAQNATDKPKQVAEKVLSALNLQGDFQLLSESKQHKLVILRYSGSGDYRITWLPSQERAIVERYLPSSLYRYLHSLHFKSGYDRKQITSNIWALIVDLISISIWLWVISGLYLWLRRRKQQRYDLLVFISGFSTFFILVTQLYI